MSNFEKDGWTFHSMYDKKGNQIINTAGSPDLKKNGAAISKRYVYSVILAIIISEKFPFLTWHLRFHFDAVDSLLSARFVEDHIHLQ